MKVSYPNTYARGQKLVRILLALAIAAAAAGMLLFREGTVQQAGCLVVSLAMLVGVVAAALRYCRCPYCGRRILGGVLVLEVCPGCRRSLYTGDKLKKNAKKGKK